MLMVNVSTGGQQEEKEGNRRKKKRKREKEGRELKFESLELFPSSLSRFLLSVSQWEWRKIEKKRARREKDRVIKGSRHQVKETLLVN